jgi:hypothetical protein
VTSFRQIEANRRNALRSHGPTTQAGKYRSRQNAVRHGLCAETVVGLLEDVDDYKGFEAAIIADYDAETAVERELVLRLASLLWRIRRAASIETSLLHTQAEVLWDRRRRRGQPLDQAYETLGSTNMNPCEHTDVGGNDGVPQPANLNISDRPFRSATLDPSRDLSVCFQRLTNFDSATFERLGRYESALARQIVQVMFLLQSARRHRPYRGP